jgi:hypothetical protein
MLTEGGDFNRNPFVTLTKKSRANCWPMQRRIDAP